VHPNYNVIQLAFATTKTGTDYDMEFNLPSGYTKTQFLTDIDALHNQNKKIILSIGGASDPIILDNPNKKAVFVTSINKILSDYSYKFDGIDLDLESTSLNFGSWTINQPAQGQLNIIDATNQIINNYQTQTGKRLLLTMAPETVYLQGGLSDWQVNNINGGSYLPIIKGLASQLDLLMPQYYNAGGATGGTFAIDGKIYYDTGDPDYIVALTETLIKGFSIKSGKGNFDGIDASKLAIGLPANSCDAAGTGYIDTLSLKNAVKYILGTGSKPQNVDYTLTASYPDFKGLMTWSINQDNTACNGNWSFAKTYHSIFSPITATEHTKEDSESIIYPNPIHSGDLIFISYIKPETAYTIYDIYGNIVRESVLTSNSFSTENLNSGIYYLKIGENKLEKIVITSQD
jgi:chitinase